MPDLTRRTALAGVAAGVLMLAGCGQVRPGERAAVSVLPHDAVVGFYGDSLTSGFAASSPQARWSTILCAKRGWREVNPSVPGIGFVQARGQRDLPALIIAEQPDLVLVTLGLNDVALVDSRGDEIEAAIDADLARLREGTDASILVAMPFVHLGVRPPQLTALEGWLRAGAGAVGAGVIESGQWMLGLRRLTVDRVHYDDEGEARIARRMDVALSSEAIHSGRAPRDG